MALTDHHNAAQGVLDTESATDVLEIATNNLQALTLQRDEFASQLATGTSRLTEVTTRLVALEVEHAGFLEAVRTLTADLERARTLITATRHEEARATATLRRYESAVKSRAILANSP